MDDSVLNEKIKKTLSGRADRIGQDVWAERNLKMKVHQRIEEETRMKRLNWKKMGIAVAAICVLGSITALGLGRASVGISHSSVNEIVTDFEQAAKMQKEYNAGVKTVKEFSNGYRFAEAVPKYNEEQDSKGNTIGKGTSMSFTYRKQGMSDISYEGRVSSMKSAGSPDLEETGADGTVFRYHYMNNKFVPVDYKPTAEEEALMKSGKLNIGYGSDEVEEMSSKSVSWTQNGISYMLFSFDNTMSGEEMIAMAKEAAQSEK